MVAKKHQKYSFNQIKPELLDDVFSKKEQEKKSDSLGANYEYLLNNPVFIIPTKANAALETTSGYTTLSFFSINHH